MAIVCNAIASFPLAGLLYIEGMRTLYLRLFLRIINRNRDVYILKILTLSVAFTCAIVISLFVINEMGYDKFHSSADSVFRVLLKNNSETFFGNRYSSQMHKNVSELDFFGISGFIDLIARKGYGWIEYRRG